MALDLPALDDGHGRLDGPVADFEGFLSRDGLQDLVLRQEKTEHLVAHVGPEDGDLPSPSGALDGHDGPHRPALVGAPDQVDARIGGEDVAGLANAHLGQPRILLRHDLDAGQIRDPALETVGPGLALLRQRRLEGQNGDLSLSAQLLLDVGAGHRSGLRAQVGLVALDEGGGDSTLDGGVVGDDVDAGVVGPPQSRDRRGGAQGREDDGVHLPGDVGVDELELLFRLAVDGGQQQLGSLLPGRLLHPESDQAEELVLLHEHPGDLHAAVIFGRRPAGRRRERQQERHADQEMNS